MELQNGLQILVIHDPTTRKIAQSVNVNVGFNYDPKNVPGLAHFVEHMVFLGSKNYPNEDELMEVISRGGGNVNAYTDTDTTNYFQDIGVDGMNEVINRVADMVLNPLMTTTATDREVMAIESEHSKNLDQDIWRFDQLIRSLANETTVYHRFSTGNLKTLKTDLENQGLNPVDQLKWFHDKYYSTNQMSLAMLSNLPVEETIDLIAPAWNDVVSKNVELPLLPKQLNTGKIVYVVPKSSYNMLKVVVPVRDLDYVNPYSNPTQVLITHLLGHEGPSSLQSELKRQGYGSEVKASLDVLGKGQTAINLDLKLTSAGLKNFRAVIKCFWNFLSILKNSSMSEFERIWQEVVKIKQIEFRYQEKNQVPSEYISNLARAMSGVKTKGKLNKILYSDSDFQEFKNSLVTEILNEFYPQNAIFIISSPEFKKSWPQNVDRNIEKWYGTNYGVEEITSQMAEEMTGRINHGIDKVFLFGRNKL